MAAINLIINENKLSYEIENNVIILKRKGVIIYEFPIPNNYNLTATLNRFVKNKYEVALDYVKDLGYFIEIEVKEYTSDTILEYDKLLKIAKDLGLNLNNIDKRGYPYHIIYNN